MQSEPNSGIKLTAYSCICWLFHRIYYDARNHKHKIPFYFVIIKIIIFIIISLSSSLLPLEVPAQTYIYSYRNKISHFCLFSYSCSVLEHFYLNGIDVLRISCIFYDLFSFLTDGRPTELSHKFQNHRMLFVVTSGPSLNVRCAQLNLSAREKV